MSARDLIAAAYAWAAGLPCDDDARAAIGGATVDRWRRWPWGIA